MPILPLGAILVSLTVSAYALYKGWKQPVIRLLVVTLLLLAAEQAVFFWRLIAVLPSQALLAQHLMQVLQVLSLNAALGFSFGYGQVYGWEKVKKQKWLLFASTLFGLLITLYPSEHFFTGLPFRREAGWIFGLGLRGQLFSVFVLLVATLILINLEKLLRSSYGRIRWQLKFSTVGLGAFFALRIYQNGKALVFNTWQPELDEIGSVGLLLACACLVIALRRATEGIDIYLSTDILKNSITALVVGSYLLVVGLLVALFRYLGLTAMVEQSFFIVAVVFLVFVLISDRSRQTVRLFTSHHFRRPSYDYRILWKRFNNSTSTVFDEDRIARDVVRIISETMQLIFVAIWIFDPLRNRFRLAGSSSTLPEEWKEIDDRDFEKLLNGSEGLIDLDQQPSFPALERFRLDNGCQGLLPLKGKDNLLGFVSFGQKVRQREISLEDRELLDMLGQQTSNALLNLSLFRKVAEVSEVEAFRNMSAFFLHDMKNLANQLSLTVENLPKYYENEEFRSDALRVLSDSVDRIKRISSGMVLLKEELRVQPDPEDLNSFVKGILAEMRPETGGMVREDYQEIPKVMIDREQMRKVVVNLILNACDAVGNGTPQKGTASGQAEALREQSPEGYPVTVSTRLENGSVVLEVADRGCGMSEQFIRESLFQAFRTTKQQGMGVGLFQSRMIVDAHRGRIEVESREGEGSSFRIILAPSV